MSVFQRVSNLIFRSQVDRDQVVTATIMTLPSESVSHNWL